MSKYNLVIVESPAKARTIEKYLGKNYKVLASVGHVKDLPDKELGVDIEKDFTPQYKIIKGKKKIIDQLKKEAENAEKVYLAPDPDREGEAIAWHISEEIKKKAKDIYRIQFNEITKKGIAEGISNPSQININRVNAQQSRRILDRLVGYMVSPLLWKPLKYGLSAGRVQSVALRLICEREEEIEKFVPKEYWIVTGFFNSNKTEIKARLEKKNGKPFEIKNKNECDNVLSDLNKSEPEIDRIDKKVVKSAAPLPFITSKLQQEAIRKLGFSAKKTMMVAQQLYEGIDLPKEGPVGLITYMRTDSTRVSQESVDAAHKYIEQNFGKEFVGKPKKASQSKTKIQDAHEAIRPTDPLRNPEDLKKYLNADQYKLYNLIWQRFIASQMADAEFYSTSIFIKVGDYEFKASGKILKFAGYTKVYTESAEENGNEEENLFYDINDNDKLTTNKYETKQQFTSPPPRYSEASLVKTLEQKGIGRPSTYASIISTLLDRKYVENEQKKLYPTELGRIVNSLLVSNFNDIFEVNFTAKMESELDEIEEGKLDWKDALKEFYNKFAPELEDATKHLKMNLVLKDIKCPKCASELVIKYGKNGPFVACQKYPDCDFTSNYKRLENGKIELVEAAPHEDSGLKCDKCDKPMVFKKSRFGEILACSGYPECKNIKSFIRKPDGGFILLNKDDKLDDKCPECGSNLVVKSGRNGMFAGCSNYPDCKFTSSISVDNDGKLKVQIIKVAKFNCEKCGSEMVLKKSRRGMFFACSKYPECKNTKSAIKTDDNEIIPKS
ncbi:type I DNA topoisomerase [Deferribacteraceae bacterium V6Fe1]|nr:type I DNA topoisomerase [Deferribacteraceae bacterium V6Fe1]